MYTLLLLYEADPPLMIKLCAQYTFIVRQTICYQYASAVIRYQYACQKSVLPNISTIHS